MAIPSKCTYCEQEFHDVVSLYVHLKKQHNLTDDSAMKIAEEQMEKWSKKRKQEFETR